MSQEPEEQLTRLRRELAHIDQEILALVERRQRIVTDIGRIKLAAGRPTRDFGQEKDVIQRAGPRLARSG